MRLLRLLGALAALLLLAGCSDGGGGGDADGDGGDAGGDVGGDPGAGASSGPSSASGMTGAGGSGAGATPQAVTLEVAATGAYPANPAFTPATASVPVGAMVHVVFRNEDAVPLIDHNWVVEGIPDAGSDTIAPGEETEFDFVAPSAPGSVTYFCAIGDHRDRGMEGTLTVA